METGALVAYCDDVKILGPPRVALAAYRRLRCLARRALNLTEVPRKGSVVWEGRGTPDLRGFPPAMPGVPSRVTHDRHLGVFIGDSRPESVAAVKAALQAKLEEKAKVVSRFHLLSDPEVKFQLLRCCISTRPGYWMRTMPPSLTLDAATWFDSQVRQALSGITLRDLPERAWKLASLPFTLGGLGITSAVESRHAAYLGSWHASFGNILQMAPAITQVTALDVATSHPLSLPFARELQEADAVITAARAKLDSNSALPLPHAAPTQPNTPALNDIGTPTSHAQKRFASVVNSARWVEVYESSDAPAKARLVSGSQQGARAAFAAIPRGEDRMSALSFVTALQLCLRLPLSVLDQVAGRVCPVTGAAVDCHGDGLLRKTAFQEYRTEGHDLVQRVVVWMLRTAKFSINHHHKDRRRPAWSPNHCPDLTLAHQSEAGSHILIDVTTVATVCLSVLRGAAFGVCHAAGVAETTKYQCYGDVNPHVVVPFAVEDGGALGKEARRLFFTCRDRCANKLLAADDDAASWSSRGFSNFFFQKFSRANLKGLAHFFQRAASVVEGNLAGRGGARGGVRGGVRGA